MIYDFDEVGGFLVCSNRGNWQYAYPTSLYANKARQNPVGIAASMARDADAQIWLPAQKLADYNAELGGKFREIALRRAATPEKEK